MLRFYGFHGSQSVSRALNLLSVGGLPGVGHVLTQGTSADLRPHRLFVAASHHFLTQVKALAHLRHDVPPSQIARIRDSSAAYALDARIPIATCGVRLLSPQHYMKFLEGSVFGNLLLDPQVKCDDVNQGTCHECPDGCY